MSAPVLQLTDVVFGYSPERAVLCGCSLTVDAGERIALLGSNGSGKTTLLHMAVGLVLPSGGRVEVFGRVRQAEADFREVRGRAGLLFQDSDDQLFSPTVAEDIAFGPLNLGHTRAEARAIVAETLDRVGLAGYEQRITYRLSGGEKRLVALATVLAMRPELLLLDEPTTGLDEAATERITVLLAGLPQAMVVVSHERPLLEALGAEAYRLENGQVRRNR